MLSHNDHVEENLKATARALSHDPLFFPPLPLSSISFLHLRGILNDAAFCHRFHDGPAYLNFLEKYTLSSDFRSFMDSVEHLRWHLAGSDIYKGTKDSLTIVRREKSSVNKSEIYEYIEEFFETGAIKNFQKGDGIYCVLDQMKKNLTNQDSFLEGAQRIFRALSTTDSLQKRKKSTSKKAKRKKEETANPEDEDNSYEQRDRTFSVMGGGKSAENLRDEQSLALSITDEKKDFLSPEGPAFLGLDTAQSTPQPYTIFTKKYDEVIDARDLASSEESLSLRQHLDLKGDLFNKQINPLALKLYRFLKTQNPIQWRFNEEEGLLNGARLTQKILDPTFPYCYKALITNGEDSLDTAITLLVDNSGSMRGRPITLAALSADVLAKVLERCGVNLEILGFTTVAWKGGRSYQDWLDSKQRANPGRLNDIRHIIYKSFSTSWRKARLSMGIMLKEGILKENIDGEALLWAAQRLMRTQERRKILIIISDGAPVDDMTLAENSSGYLENHLKSVIQVLGQHPSIQLFAIGIGHDVGRIYPNAVLIKSAESLGKTLFEELPRLLKGIGK